jgi:hypothetical protein
MTQGRFVSDRIERQIVMDQTIEQVIERTKIENHGALSRGTIEECFAAKGLARDTIFSEQCYRKMKIFGLITDHFMAGPDDKYYMLTEKGWQFESFAKEKEKQDLSYKQMQSVIDTNASVSSTNTAIQNNIPVQNRQNRFSIGVAVASAVFIALSILQACLDPTSKEVKLMREELQQIKTEIRGLKSSPDEKRDSIQTNMGKDSSNN